MKRIQSLDGLRAISIILVLLAHASGTAPALVDKYISCVANSGLGVNIFFLISGYLITKLLIIDKDKNGIVSLKDFYLRRALRIFPVFYLYILAVILLKKTIAPSIFVNYQLACSAALYVWNYMHLFVKGNGIPDNGYWFFGHFWSLAMEEQFYLLWPLLFIKLKKPALIKTVCIIIIAMPFIRVATYFLMPNSRGQIGMMLQTGGDTILFGCLGALIEDSAFFKEKLYKYLTNNVLMTFIIAYLFLLSPLISLYIRGYDVVIGKSIGNVCIMALVFWVIKIPSKIAGFLNTTIMVQIGILSYSLYIWQQLF